jgi:nucleotide-binding universal stress UspA family protein
MARTVVIGVDGSEPSQRAVAWTAAYAATIGAEVVVVNAIEPLPYASWMGPEVAPIPLGDKQRETLEAADREWCKPLADHGVPYRVEIIVEAPAVAIRNVARGENAELVVVGRRGRGGFAELLLGSVSHALAHHVGRPLVIIP